jgi:hypothetical protein
MTPTPKPVSESVMERVSVAIDALQLDGTLPRTKRELERLSGLSHATIARAFHQDLTQPVSKWRITDRFATVTAATGGRSAQSVQKNRLLEQLMEKNARIRDLHQILDNYSQALYAMHAKASEDHSGVTHIGVNRNRRPSR